MSSHHIAGPHLTQYELSQHAAERYAVLAAVKEALGFDPAVDISPDARHDVAPEAVVEPISNINTSEGTSWLRWI